MSYKIVKKNYIRRISVVMTALMILAGGLASCNSKSEPVEEVAVTLSTVAVKDFKLSANSNVMTGLDTVFFSIDLNRGIIFNADSLPKGADITKLVPVITFANTVSKAEIIMTGGTVRNDTVNYLTNSSDSIDFTGKVKLNVTAYDGVNSYSYILKVNVHEQNPDSLMWNKMDYSPLPSRLGRPVAQKSVKVDKKVVSLIEESDGSYTLATADEVASSGWTKESVSPGFIPDVRSLSYAGGIFYILDERGALYESDDCKLWSPTGETWITLIGPYMDSVLGVKVKEGGLMHCHYPASSLITDTEVAEGFPMSGRSDFNVIESKYSNEPTAFFVGGYTSEGDLSNATWAFDGSVWAQLGETPTDGIGGASVFHYIIYRKTSSAFKFIEMDAWLLIGGELPDGSYNRTTYVSYDNGVTWRPSYGTLTLPSVFPSMTGADVIVLSSPLDANLADEWTNVLTLMPATRVDYTLDGTEIMWECPYIYIFGGVMEDGMLSTDVWRGVLARLSFTPII